MIFYFVIGALASIWPGYPMTGAWGEHGGRYLPPLPSLHIKPVNTPFAGDIDVVIVTKNSIEAVGPAN